MEDGGILLSEKKFRTLADRYTLSPRQREIARLLLSGRLHDVQLTKAIGISQKNLGSQMNRMCNKMHCRGRAAIMYRFWEDSLSTNPGEHKT